MATKVDDGDGVLLPDPIYDAYASRRSAGGRPFSRCPAHRVGPVRLRGTPRSAARPSRVLVLNTPWNPVGTVFRDRTVDDRDFAIRHDLRCSATRSTKRSSTTATHVSPATRVAAHRGTDDPRQQPVEDLRHDRLAGRLLAGPAEVIAAMLLVLQQSSRGPATFVQDAAACALIGSGVRAKMRQEYPGRRDTGLERPGGILGASASRSRGRLLRDGGRARAWDDRRTRSGGSCCEHGVVVMHGAAYGPGGEGTLRVSFASGGDTLTPTASAASAAGPGAQGTSGALNGDGLVASYRRSRRAKSGSTRFPARTPPNASVYQIEPLGVVVARNARRPHRLVAICAKFRCPLTLRGGGTSQAGQAIGAGSSSTPRNTSTACSR